MPIRRTLKVNVDIFWQRPVEENPFWRDPDFILYDNTDFTNELFF